MRRITPVPTFTSVAVVLWLVLGAVGEQTGRFTPLDPNRLLSDIPGDGPIFARHRPTHRVIYRPATTGDHLYPVEVSHWWGLMNQSGYLVVFPRFQWAEADYDNLSRVVLDGKTGFISALGDFIIDPIYPYADRFAEGYAVVGKKIEGAWKYGFIDRTGKVIFPVKLDGARRFSEGLAVVRVGDKCGYINQAGDFAVKPRFVAARSLHDGAAAVQFFDADGKPGPWGYIDKSGRVLMRDTTGRITALGDFYDGLARVRVGQTWGYIGKDFKLRIRPRFEDARDFVGGVAAVKALGRWGYVNKSGKAAVKPRFVFADDLDDTFAMVAITDDGDGEAGGDRGGGTPGVRYGYVNRVASQGIAPQFLAALPFSRGLARVSQAPSFGYINTAGRVVWDPREALSGILDFRLGARLLARRADLLRRGSITVSSPPPRPPQNQGYPPEYRYRDALPLATDGLDSHADNPSPQPR